MSQHAKLSPSGADLDFKCPGNRRMQEKFPNARTIYTDKGTGAHCLGEICLRRGHDIESYRSWWCGAKEDGSGFLDETPVSSYEEQQGVRGFKVDEDMIWGVSVYVNHVRDIIRRNPGCKAGVEVKSYINEHVWGTADNVIVMPGQWLWVNDYKNGRTYVDEQTHAQFPLYALGFILPDNPYRVKEVCWSVIQPFGEYGEPVRTIRPKPVEEVITWWHDVYKPVMLEALKPDAPLNPGPWCSDMWCNARHSCSARIEQHNTQIATLFDAAPVAKAKNVSIAEILNPEQRCKILDRKKDIEDMLKSVYEYEKEQHFKGQGIWGKLIKGRNSYSFKDEKVVESLLYPSLQDKIYTDRVLRSVSQMKTIMKNSGYSAKQVEAELGDHILVTPGKPSLVAEDAKGVTVSPVAEMFK